MMSRNTKVLLVFSSALALLAGLSLATFFMKNPTSLSVGSKNFTEQIILGEVIAQLLEQRFDIDVERKFNLGGTFICFNSLKTGQIGLYVEYTGTGLTSILNKQVINDEKEVYHICKKEFEKKWDLIWLKSLGFNNTYTITMRKQHADRLGVSAISDLERYQDELSAGFDHEFLARPDGYPGLIGHYGFKFKKPPRAMDTGLMYKAIADKQVDVICGFATDGRIPAFDLVILVDDKRFFPPYFAAPLVRGDILARFPGMRAVLNELAGKISNAEMARMNYLVDKGGERPAKVGEDFLRRKGLI